MSTVTTAIIHFLFFQCGTDIDSYNATENDKITDFLMILAWACPFKIIICIVSWACSNGLIIAQKKLQHPQSPVKTLQ